MWVLQLLTLLLKPTGQLLEDSNGCKAWHPVVFSLICWMNENFESQTIEEGSFFSLLSFVEFKRWSSTEKEWSRSGWHYQNLTLISFSGKLHLVHLKCSMNCGNVPVLGTSIMVPRSTHTLLSCEYIDLRTRWVKHVGSLPGDPVLVQRSFVVLFMDQLLCTLKKLHGFLSQYQGCC